MSFDSVRKDSLSRSESEATVVPSPPRPETSCYVNDTYFPPSACRRPYLAARFLSVLFGLILCGLSTAAAVCSPTQNWLAPVLNPAIAAGAASLCDIVSVLRCNRRMHPLQRLIHDGLLAIGTSVAVGFMFSIALPVVRDGVQPAAALARLIWLFMFGLM